MKLKIYHATSSVTSEYGTVPGRLNRNEERNSKNSEKT